MGCLFELLFEFIFELLIEIIFAIYIKLMTLFVPDREFDEKTREKIKKGVTVFAVSLLICAVIGFILILIPDPAPIVKTIGSYMLFVPLIIIGIEIIAGIIYRIVKAIKKKR